MTSPKPRPPFKPIEHASQVLSQVPHLDQPAATTWTPIDIRLEGGFLIAQCGRSFEVYELVWESRHGEQRRRLTMRRLPGVPRQFEAEAIRVMHPTG